MLKMIATITYFGAAANIGGDPERVSVIIDIPTKNIPNRLKRHLESEPRDKKYETLSISLLDQEL